MLLMSYIIVAAYELAMTVTTFQQGNLSFAWSFGFLLLLSVASIPMETSKTGQMVRAEFKALGVNTAKYDFASNMGRAFVYSLILVGILSQIQGLIAAYLITFVMLARAIWKYSVAQKK